MEWPGHECRQGGRPIKAAVEKRTLKLRAISRHSRTHAIESNACQLEEPTSYYAN